MIYKLEDCWKTQAQYNVRHSSVAIIMIKIIELELDYDMHNLVYGTQFLWYPRNSADKFSRQVLQSSINLLKNVKPEQHCNMHNYAYYLIYQSYNV